MQYAPCTMQMHAIIFSDSIHITPAFIDGALQGNAGGCSDLDGSSQVFFSLTEVCVAYMGLSC